METQFLIQLGGLLLALSGWGKVAFDFATSNPKVRGRILNVMRGQMTDPSRPQEKLTSFVTYLYLVNARKNIIHLLDYELSAKVSGKWLPLQRVYGIHNIENLTFLAPDGAPIQINEFSSNLIYRKNQAAEFGKPLHGWIVFAGPPELHVAEVTDYRVRCIDAYAKRHTFTSAPDNFGNLYLLQDMAGISLPESARRSNSL